jgi:hypothetical protein
MLESTLGRPRVRAAERAASVKDAVANLPRQMPNMPGRTGGYVKNQITKTLADMD